MFFLLDSIMGNYCIVGTPFFFFFKFFFQKSENGIKKKKKKEGEKKKKKKKKKKRFWFSIKATNVKKPHQRDVTEESHPE